VRNDAVIVFLRVCVRLSSS